MEIKKKYLTKYLHDIAIEQIADDYIQMGYNVNKEASIGNYQADILARKGNENIVIEVKSGKMTLDRKKQIAGLANYVHSLGGYKFLVVVATSPKEKKLKIDNIEQLITDYLHKSKSEAISGLAFDCRPDSVIDVDLDEMRLSGNLIEVIGSGVVSVEQQIFSDGNNGIGEIMKTLDNFPFDFEMKLRKNDDNAMEIVEVNKLNIDMSS